MSKNHPSSCATAAVETQLIIAGRTQTLATLDDTTLLVLSATGSLARVQTVGKVVRIDVHVGDPTRAWTAIEERYGLRLGTRTLPRFRLVVELPLLPFGTPTYAVLDLLRLHVCERHSSLAEAQSRAEKAERDPHLFHCRSDAESLRRALTGESS